MNQSAASAQTTLGLQKQHATNTRLTGRWLMLTRVVWAILIIITLGIFVVCLPLYFSLFQTICTGAACANGQLSPAAAQTLQHLGISLGQYAALNLALMLIWALVWFMVGAIIAWRRSNDWMALLVAIWLVLSGTTNATLAVSSSQSSWQWPAFLLNNLAFLFLELVFFLFPNGRFVPRWTRWVMLAYVVLVLLFLFPDLSSFQPLLQFGGGAFIIFSQIYRYRRASSPVQRQQTKWVVYGLTVTIVCDFIASLPVFLLPLFFPSIVSTTFGSFYLIFFQISIIFFTFLIPISFGIAMLRHQLWDIDIIINRTLVYGTLTAILALVYCGLIFALQYLLRGIINQNNDVVIVVSTLAIAALFLPLHRRIQQVIDRRFYRRKYDAARTLAAFSATLRTEVDLTQLSEHLITVVQETMQPSHVSLWLPPVKPDRKQQTAWRSIPRLSPSITQPGTVIGKQEDLASHTSHASTH